MTTFFWADTHFNHAGILKHCSRPYRSVGEMNEALVARWNDAVTRESDEVWVLGDFGFSPRPAQSEGEDLGVIFHRLRGRKRLVVGNHDERNPKVLRLPWERVESLATFRDAGCRAELCHYALESWKGAHTGALMLHGHSHGSLRRQVPRRFDVGADVFPRPVAWEELLALAAGQTFVPQDHHGERAEDCS